MIVAQHALRLWLLMLQNSLLCLLWFDYNVNFILSHLHEELSTHLTCRSFTCKNKCSDCISVERLYKLVFSPETRKGKVQSERFAKWKDSFSWKIGGVLFQCYNVHGIMVMWSMALRKQGVMRWKMGHKDPIQVLRIISTNTYKFMA